MGRQEFIDRLRAALNGRLPSALVADHVNYYEDYIQSQIRRGQSEEEVLGALGDPRLIARTIIETNAVEEQGQDGRNGCFQGYGQSEEQGFYRAEDYEEYGGYSRESRQKEYQGGRNGFSLRLPGWLLGLLCVIVFAGIIFVVVSALSFLAPVLGIILLVVFLMKLFRDWLN